MKIRDMPKLESPFVRTVVDGEYVVTHEIAEGFEWVFEGGPDEVLCVEKLDGTNVSIIVEDGVIKYIFNRTKRIPFFTKGSVHIVQGLLESFGRGYCNFTDGQYFGELIGEKLNGNPHKIEGHLWIPFNSYARDKLSYRSWHKYPKTFENVSKWFQTPLEEGGIFSLFARRKERIEYPEGVVFHNLKTGQMAKLRRDMFPWYEGKRHGRKKAVEGDASGK